MANQSTLKSRPVSQVEQVLVGILLVLPLLGLLYCWKYRVDIHFQQPGLNLAVHIAMLVLPLLWAAWASRSSILVDPDNATYLGATPFWVGIRSFWWMILLMCATPIVASLVLGQSLVLRYFSQPESLSTSPGRAIGLTVMIFVLGMFYLAAFADKDARRVWVSDSGFRKGLRGFHEWKSIHHVSTRGNLCLVHHCARPALPAFSLWFANSSAEETFKRFAAEHNVPISNEESPLLGRVKIIVTTGFLFNLGFSIWLRFASKLSGISVILVSAGIGVIFSLCLDHFRGSSQYGKVKINLERPD